MTETTTIQEVRQSTAKRADEAGLTLDEFIEAGLADSLTDGDLRDLWLIYKSVLVPPTPET